MHRDILNKLLLGIIVLLLLLNFVQGLVSTKNAAADKGDTETGRYQISAWAAQTSVGYHHSGYYIVDTATGKVVDSKAEVHTSKE
jgi:hypothetical protein